MQRRCQGCSSRQRIPQKRYDDSSWCRQLYFSAACNNCAELGLNAPFVVGYFGRVEQYKGVELLVNALARFSNRDWQLSIVGTGGYEESLRQTAHNLSIDKNIVLAGAVPMEQVPRYLNACDVVVIPSCTTPTWKEQFGRVATEAMACGIPVITSDSGSLPEVVGDAGIIVAEQNSDAIFEALQRLAEDQDYRKKSSQRLDKPGWLRCTHGKK